MNGISAFHSVTLDDPVCKGCTICVTGCPAEAIRVHRGKAHILEERCIDCGECIRRCPSRAKRAVSAQLETLKDFPESVALVSPSFYAQFDLRYTLSDIYNALRGLGFSRIIDVSREAVTVSDITAHILLTEKDIQKPLISSSCPAVIKLVQIRFPSLIGNLLPVLPPVEIAARKARALCGEKAGIFFISPCPAKITEPRSPSGYEKSEITASFSTLDIYLPLLVALKNVTQKAPNDEDKERVPRAFSWGAAGGEAKMLVSSLRENNTVRWVSCDGIRETIEVLESIEDGKLSGIDFAEISACAGGCIGGALAVQSVPLARAILRERGGSETAVLPKTPEEELDLYRWTRDIIQRPALMLSPDFTKARKMMQEMEEIYESLPGLDCGSCGSPNCRSLADDIVRKLAKKEDCIHILKQEYERLVFGKTKQ